MRQLAAQMGLFKDKPLIVPNIKTAVTEPPPTKVEIEVPTVSAPIPQKLAPKPKVWTIPDKYKAMTPLVLALQDSTITSDEAKAAVLSQMGLETGWKTPSDYNYGNITAGSSWKGPVRVRPDKDAEGNPITQNFRSYSSSKEFLNDYLKLLKTQYPTAYNELHNTNFDINKFTSGLVDENFKYAQDPTYKSSVANVYGDVIQSILEQ